MVGGRQAAVERLDPIFEALAPGSRHDRTHAGPRGPRSSAPSTAISTAGPAGAGHFVKMIHNGIEYGLMQAYAEGFDILRNVKLDGGAGGAALRARPRRYRRGLAARQRRLLLAARSRPRSALAEDPDLDGLHRLVSTIPARAAGRSRRRSRRRCRPMCSRRRSMPASARARTTPSPRACCRRCASKFGGHVRAAERTERRWRARNEWP